MIRKSIVAGKFYPGDEKKLYQDVKRFIEAGAKEKKDAAGVVVPHAGYIFSGKVAGLTYSCINVPEEVVVIGPNHTGIGSSISMMTQGKWQIPGSEVEIDKELAENILRLSSYAKDEPDAHMMEHSIEVQLPFLKFCNKNVKIVPIIMGTREIEPITDLGEAVAHSIEKSGKKVLIVASSDMSHYVSQKEAEKYDYMAIEKIEVLNPEGLMDVVKQESISMCGAAPAAVMLKAVKILQSRKAELVHYNTSAEATGDTQRVVGYAGIRVF
ncbi:MAG: AmmeMemoRadiSam system protein B [Elusimicrobiota bacterium]